MPPLPKVKKWKESWYLPQQVAIMGAALVFAFQAKTTAVWSVMRDNSQGQKKQFEKGEKR